jgi:hypothetical protein
VPEVALTRRRRPQLQKDRECVLLRTILDKLMLVVMRMV